MSNFGDVGPYKTKMNHSFEPIIKVKSIERMFLLFVNYSTILLRSVQTKNEHMKIKTNSTYSERL